MKFAHVLFFVFSVAYLLLMFKGPFPGSWAIKAVPALALAAMVAMNQPALPGKLIIAGLIFSAGGDIALALYKDNIQQYFIVGLALFLVAHILYIVAFSRDFSYQPSRLPLAIAVVALSAVMGYLLFPKLGPMLIPVVIYILAITVMGVFASFSNRGGWILILGAILFMMSDSMIAVNKFMFAGSLKWAPMFIMVTYFAAQYFISQPYRD